MTPELTALAVAGLLHIAAFSVFSYMANVDVGPGYTTSPRDRAPSRDMRKTTARMMRVYDNSVAQIGLFAAGALLIAVSEQSTQITALAAWAFVALRALYIPAYVLGWQPWRSFIWLGAMACCAVLFIAALV